MKSDMTRQEANRKILEKIRLIVEQEPDWRFHQILQNLEIVQVNNSYSDQWYEESIDTLNNCVDFVL